MGQTYTYDSEKNIVYTELSGTISIKLLSDYAFEVLDDETVQKNFVEVVDFSKVIHYPFAFSGAVHLPTLFSQWKKEKQYVGSVFIAPRPIQFGMARMIATLFEAHGKILVIKENDELAEAIKTLRPIISR